jgi:hypothetical protein
MTARRFPNLFIVGAMKAGTSSLHEYLHQHPDIFMSRFKEPQYFAPHRTRYGLWGQGNPLPEPGIDWYLRLFAQAQDVQYAGESSVSYTARHWVPDCEQRLWQFNPQARIIYLMRDPVERALSHYWHFVAAGRETLPPLAAVRRRDDYLARSDYAYQIEPYLRRFGEDQVYLLTTEELERRPQQTLAALFRWLGVADDVPIDTRQRHNVTPARLRQARRLAGPLVDALQGWRWQQWGPRLPAALRRGIEWLAYREVDRAAVETASAEAYLRQRLWPRVEALRRLSGRDYPLWTTLFADTPRHVESPLESHDLAPSHPTAQRSQPWPVASADVVYRSQIDCR